MACATDSCLVNANRVTYKLNLWNKWPYNKLENWAASKIQAAKGLNLSGAVRIYPTPALSMAAETPTIRPALPANMFT